MARKVEKVVTILTDVTSDFANDPAADNGAEILHYTVRVRDGIDASAERMDMFVKALRKAGIADLFAIAVDDGTKPAGAGTSGGNTEQAAARAWAKANGIEVADRGRVKADVVQQWKDAGSPIVDGEAPAAEDVEDVTAEDGPTDAEIEALTAAE